MGKARIKVTVTPKKSARANTLLASVPVTIAPGKSRPNKLYETKAELTAHINYGKRPSKSRFRRVD